MQSIDFQLDRNHVELNQLLKLAGVCDSGGAGKALVASGAVRVDGAVEMRKTCKIRAGQRVEVGEVRIEIGRAHVWTPVTNAHLVCRLLLEKKKKKRSTTNKKHS